MNNTELKQVVQKIKECNNSDSQIEFYINELISDIVTPILTAAKVSSVDEVVALLERKRDHQGFLINTDVDDTMEVKNTFLQSSLVNAMKFGNETMEHLFVSLGERLGKFKPLSDEDIEDEAEKYARPLAEDHKHRIHWDGIKNYWKEGFRKAVELHANRPQAGWIDVKDRLPSVEDEYLIYNGELDDIQVSYYDMISWGYLASVIPNVTHWMKLPPKPKQ